MFLWLSTTSNPSLTRLVQSDLHWGFSSENSLVISLQRTWSTWTWSWWSCSCSCSSGWSSSKWQWSWWSCLCSSWSTWWSTCWSGSSEHSDRALLLLRDHLLNGSGIITISVMIIIIWIIIMIIIIIIIVLMKFRWETLSSCMSLLSQEGCRYFKVFFYWPTLKLIALPLLYFF